MVLPETIIHSNEWRAYTNLQALGYEHNTVNHSAKFVELITGVHTKHIESYWAKNKLESKNIKGVKRKFSSEYLDEFMWKDNIAGDCFKKH